MRGMLLYVAEVTGTGTFPIDMLRRDACFPMDDHAVDVIIHREGQGEWTCRIGKHVPGPCILQKAFNVERWKSYGCTIKFITDANHMG